jgi:hypothetical protein
MVCDHGARLQVSADNISLPARYIEHALSQPSGQGDSILGRRSTPIRPVGHLPPSRGKAKHPQLLSFGLPPLMGEGGQWPDGGAAL